MPPLTAKKTKTNNKCQKSGKEGENQEKKGKIGKKRKKRQGSVTLPLLTDKAAWLRYCPQQVFEARREYTMVIIIKVTILIISVYR